jgi:hypothetical protein
MDRPVIVLCGLNGYVIRREGQAHRVSSGLVRMYPAAAYSFHDPNRSSPTSVRFTSDDEV